MSRRDEYHYWMMLCLQSHSPSGREVADGQLCSQLLESLHQPDESPDADLFSESTVDDKAAIHDLHAIRSIELARLGCLRSWSFLAPSACWWNRDTRGLMS